MWLLLGVADTSEVITWPYKADVNSLEQICEFARANAPITIWTPTNDMARSATAICNHVDVVGRPVSDVLAERRN